MTYTSGSVIMATDVTDLVGSTNNTQAYANLAACAGKLSAIYGVGWGTYGYGQANFVLPTPSAGTIITSQAWLFILQSIQTIALHTGTNLSSYNLPVFTPPTTNYLAVGNIIATSNQQFVDPGSTSYDWSGAIAAIEADRLTNDTGRMLRETLPSLTSLRTSTFNSLIYHELTATFASEDAARFFFNAGGQIRLSAQIAAGTYTGENLVWANFLDPSYTNLGYWSMGGQYTSQVDGSSPPASGIGYYNLTTSYTTVLTTTFGAGPTYAITLEAKKDSGVSINGGNGYQITFKFSFDPSSQNITVPLTTEIFNYRPKTSQELATSTPYPITVATPQYATVVELSGVPGPAFWPYTDTITGRQWNYNIYEKALSFGYDPATLLPIGFILVLQSCELLSADPLLASLTVPSTMPVGSNVIVVVSADSVIAGRGGTGGTGAPSGVCGCNSGGPGSNGSTAVQLQASTQIVNYGIIGGGGGGGGGGGAECSYIWNASAGGGGGGAGIESNGGTVDLCGVTLGRGGQPGVSGTILLGGAGGAAGNAYTAGGGNGGNLGTPGSPGQTIDAPGGAGGLPGYAITGTNWLFGSQLGDIRGPTLAT